MNATENDRLITFLSENASRVLDESISEKEACEASGIAPNKIGPALWEAEPVAVPEAKFSATKESILDARKNGVRWERIAARTGVSVPEAKEIGGREAQETYTGRGRRPCLHIPDEKNETLSTRKAIIVYVRLCDGDEQAPCREMSFRIPQGITQSDLLEAGWALDGHSAVKTVIPFEDGWLADALLSEQRELIAWLGKHGYSVEFK